MEHFRSDNGKMASIVASLESHLSKIDSHAQSVASGFGWRTILGVGGGAAAAVATVAGAPAVAAMLAGAGAGRLLVTGAERVIAGLMGSTSLEGLELSLTDDDVDNELLGVRGDES